MRELADRHPIALVNSVNSSASRARRPPPFEIVEELGDDLDALCIPVGNAGNITAYWKGFREVGDAPRDVRLPGRGRGAARRGRAGRATRDGRERDPDRQPGALGGGDGRDELLARRGESGHATRRSSTPTASSPRARASSASRPPRPRSRACWSTAPATPSGSSCVLTGHGLKDPDTALDQAGARRPVRADAGRRRARPSWARRARFDLGTPPRRPRARLVGQPRPGLRHVRRGARRCTSSSRSSRPAASRSRPTCDIARDRRNLVRARRSSGCTPPDDFTFRIRSEIPLSGGLGSSAAAFVAGLTRRRPPVRARRRPPRARDASSRAIPTTSPPRCTAAS